MSPHERFEAALSRIIPDRLAMDLIWPRKETLDALKEYFGAESDEVVFRELGIDFRWIPIPAYYPEFEDKVNGILEGDAPGAGGKYIFHDPRTFEDHWGVVHQVGDDGKYLEWKYGPLKDSEMLAGWSLPKVVYPSSSALFRTLQPFADFVTVTEIEFPFKLAWNLCGYEHFLTQMSVNPDMVELLYDKLYGFQTRKAVLAAESGFDIVAIVGDIAGQTGLMFSPLMFRRFDVPRLGRLIEEIKRTNPRVKVLYHSDGDIETAMPMLIECGIDIINPVQSACMDPAKMKKMYGKRLVFHGTISVQDTVPNGRVADVMREVVRRIETVGYDGGLIVSPENSIPYNAPLENILAIYNTVKTYDYRSLKQPSYALPKR